MVKDIFDEPNYCLNIMILIILYLLIINLKDL